MLGIALVAGGAAGLNQIYERDTDSLMFRTRMRPLAAHRVTTGEALVFSLALAALGLGIVAATSNLLAAFLALLTPVSYNVVYTPMKRRSQLATLVGAVPGALPPMIGWVAARGALTPEAWALFAIVFVWQIPHFMAIAWLYRADFSRAGFPLLPVVEPTGRSTARQAVLFSLLLVPLSLVPYFLGMSGPAYAVGAVTGSAALLWLAISFALRRTRRTSAAAVSRLDHVSACPLGDVDSGPPARGQTPFLRFSKMIDYTVLPTVNATLNAISGMFLLVGYVLIRRRQINAHRNAMLGAFASSTLFLISYLVYHAHAGSRPFTGQGAIRYVYFAILISHVILAAAILPMAISTLSRGLRGQICRPQAHREMDVPDVDVRVGDRRDCVPDALSDVSQHNTS